MQMDTERIWVRIPVEKMKMYKEWATKIGIPVSQFVAICAWAGAQTVVPSLDPDAYTALKMVHERLEEEAMQNMADEYIQESEEWEEFLEWRKQKGLVSNGE